MRKVPPHIHELCFAAGNSAVSAYPAWALVLDFGYLLHGFSAESDLSLPFWPLARPLHSMLVTPAHVIGEVPPIRGRGLGCLFNREDAEVLDAAAAWMRRCIWRGRA